MRRLILLRHARASDHSVSGRDRDRPLTDAGRADAAAQAKRLEALGVSPDRMIASAAWRAAETAAIVGPVLGLTVPHDSVAAVYDASAGELIGVLEERPGTEVLLVGHNPAISGLASLLCGEPIALSAGGFAILEFKPPAEHPLQPGSARVAASQPRP